MNADNHHSLTGYVGTPPERKVAPDGTPIARFSVSQRKRKKEDPPRWFQCVAFGKTAETILQYVRSGRYLTVLSELVPTSWTDKAGNKREGMELRVFQVQLHPEGRSDAVRSQAAAPVEGGREECSPDEFTGDGCPF